MEEVEKGVIEAILYDNSLFDLGGLQEDDFSVLKHRKTYAAICSIIGQGLEADILSITDAGVRPADAASYSPYTSANFEHYCDRLKEASARRKMARLLESAKSRLESPKDEVVEVISSVERGLYEIVNRKTNNVRMVGEFLHDTIERIELEYQAKGPVGVRTGYESLDEMTNGFEPEELIVLAARTSIGKTALAINMAENMAEDGVTAGFFSLEMSGVSLVRRILSSRSGLSNAMLRSGLVEAGFHRLSEAAAAVYEWGIYLDDTPSIGMAELQSKARIMKRKGVEIIIIDYLSLISMPNRDNLQRHDLLGEATKTIKGMARDLQIPIVLIHQLNRVAEDEEPKLSHLSQSGQIEHHADEILLLHRDRGEGDMPATLIVAKQRNGPTGEVPLHFHAERTRYVEPREGR